MFMTAADQSQTIHNLYSMNKKIGGDGKGPLLALKYTPVHSADVSVLRSLPEVRQKNLFCPEGGTRSTVSLR